MKISIAIPYFNRKTQFELVLDNFEKKYALKYNFEVIIVDDFSQDSEMLDEIIKKYNFPIKLIKILKKDWINPVIPFNLALEKCNGDIIILQSPEIFHCGNILEDILQYDFDNIYYTYPIFSSPSFEENQLIRQLFEKNETDFYKNFVKKIDLTKYDFDYEYYTKKYQDISNLNYEKAISHWNNCGIKENRTCNSKKHFISNIEIYKWKGWYNHIKYNPRNLHFLSAFHKSLLDKIGGFCSEFKDGYFYDDDDFLARIKKICKIKLIDSNLNFGIHLYHTNGSNDIYNKYNFDKLRLNNYNVFKKNIDNSIVFCNKDLSKYNLKLEIYQNAFF